MPNFSYFHGYSTGYWMSSCSSIFVFSSPPMSFHVVFGTSTIAVSRRVDGLVVEMASRKCAWVTNSLSSTSASIVSSSQSMRCSFSLMQFIAASVQSCARSAPTYPCVSFATASRSTFSSSFMFFVWMLMISRRPISSGMPMSSSGRVVEGFLD
eukprot:gene22882-biopygen23223